MKQNVYVIHDMIAKTYTQPLYFHNDGEAKRMFYQWVNNPELPMSDHRQDYSFYHIGYYDTDEGKLESVEIPNLIVKGSSVPPTLKAVGDSNNE